LYITAEFILRLLNETMCPVNWKQMERKRSWPLSTYHWEIAEEAEENHEKPVTTRGALPSAPRT